jgi:hypothetical protein
MDAKQVQSKCKGSVKVPRNGALCELTMPPATLSLASAPPPVVTCPLLPTNLPCLFIFYLLLPFSFFFCLLSLVLLHSLPPSCPPWLHQPLAPCLPPINTHARAHAYTHISSLCVRCVFKSCVCMCVFARAVCVCWALAEHLYTRNTRL